MERRGVLVVIGGVTVAVLLVLASSSAPDKLWTVPSSVAAPPTTSALDTGPLVTVTVPPVASDRQADESGFLQVVGLLLVIAIVVGLVRFLRSRARRPRRRRVERRRKRQDFAVLPEVDDLPVAVDVEAAREALAGEGDPRNSIIACWMELDRQAATAGLARRASETSAEYAERVLSGSPVDPVPIGDLAALYREARFSRHELDDGHRSRAFDALERIARALPVPAGAPT